MATFSSSRVVSTDLRSHGHFVTNVKLLSTSFYGCRLFPYVDQWMLVKGYIKKLCGETPTGLRMGVPAPVTNFVGLSVI
jgi:hypothetical protein